MNVHLIAEVTCITPKHQSEKILLNFATSQFQDLASLQRCFNCVLTTEQKGAIYGMRKLQETLSAGRGVAERKHCIVTERHVNDYVFPRLLDSALKHENKHRLWHRGNTVLRMYNPRVRLASWKRFKTFFSVCVCAVHSGDLFTYISSGQNEALGHCLRYITRMRHCTSLETEACPQSFQCLLTGLCIFSDEIREVLRRF